MGKNLFATTEGEREGEVCRCGGMGCLRGRSVLSRVSFEGGEPRSVFSWNPCVSLGPEGGGTGRDWTTLDIPVLYRFLGSRVDWAVLVLFHLKMDKENGGRKILPLQVSSDVAEQRRNSFGPAAAYVNGFRTVRQPRHPTYTKPYTRALVKLMNVKMFTVGR